jgi:hypothetical protein
MSKEKKNGTSSTHGCIEEHHIVPAHIEVELVLFEVLNQRTLHLK